MKVHTFSRGDIVATWYDTGAFGAQLLIGAVIAAGPKAYRVRWESGNTNRVEQGRTIVWLHNDWKDWTETEIKRVEARLGVSVDRPQDKYFKI